MTHAETWWGVLNPAGQLSQLYSMRGLAESALGERQDRDGCRVVSAQVAVDLTPLKPEAPKKRGKK